MAQAQSYTIGDTSICSGGGIYIGKPNSDPELCYTWDPDPSFVNGDYHNPNPLVKPDDTTTYTLTVTGNNFAFREVETVTVNVGLGGIVTDPSFTEPDSLQEQIVCHVTNKPPGVVLEWFLTGPDGSGCEVHPQNGVIGGCKVPGTYTVNIIDVNNEECYAEADFDVNVGVRDVYAFDAADPQRFARTGEKLWLVGRNAVNFKATPNPGFDFEPDQPFWQGDFVVLPNYVSEWTHDEPTPLEFTMGAGGKSVQVEKQDAVSGQNDVLGVLNLLFSKIIQKIKPPDENAATVQTPVCVPFDIVPSYSLVYKNEPVNRWKSPLVGVKKSLTGGASITITGKQCLPPPYSSPDLYVLKYSTYFFITGAAGLSANLAYDESIAYPAEWKVNGLDFSGSITIGVRGEFAITVPGDAFDASGSLTGAASVSLNPDFNPSNNLLTGKATVSPLYLEANLVVWYLNPNNKIVNLSGRYNVMDPFSTDNITIYQFD